MINALKKEFESNLKVVYKLLSDIDSTNNIQLDRLCNELFGSKFYGVFPSDKIPKLNFHKKYCILNLDKSNQPGSHWIACVLDGNDDIYIFDTYDRSIKKILPIIYKVKHHRILSGNKSVLQKIDGEDCGQRCIAWLLLVEKYGIDVAKKI
jgi:hypothetical protein